MRKTLIAIVLMVLFGHQSFSQGYPSPFKIEVIDSLPGSKNELFVKANEWVAKTFVDAKEVIQMSDKDAGRIIAKGVMETYTKVGATKGKYYTKYTMEIDVKDSKARIIFSDFITYECIVNNGHNPSINYSLDNIDHPKSGMSYGDKMWRDIKDYCLTQSNILTTSFIATMKNKNDNW